MTLRITCLIFYLLSVQQAFAANFVEGIDYDLINQNSINEKNTVTEYFSFSCSGCYYYEKYIGELEKSPEPGIKFSRVHVSFGGKKPKQSQRAFVLMTMLGEDTLTGEIFSKVHKEKPFKNDKDVIAFFKQRGFEQQELETMIASPEAKAMLKSLNQIAKSAQVSSVPTVLVNGKYRIKLANINSVSKLKSLIQHLNTLP